MQTATGLRAREFGPPWLSLAKPMSNHCNRMLKYNVTVRLTSFLQVSVWVIHWVVGHGSESESELPILYDWRFTADQFILATSPLRLTRSNFIFQLNTCSYVTPSLTRGCVCRLQFFSGPRQGSHSQVRVLRFETPPTWRARSPYLYPLVTGWRSYTPRHWVPFSSAPTAHRAMVEVFEPASARVYDLRFSHQWLWEVLSAESVLCLPSAFTLVSCFGLFFESENGNDMFLRNAGWFSTDYTALFPRRQNSSYIELFCTLDNPYIVRTNDCNGWNISFSTMLLYL
jgi:hypothetical protein